jgi:hypothetical protein
LTNGQEQIVSLKHQITTLEPIVRRLIRSLTIRLIVEILYIVCIATLSILGLSLTVPFYYKLIVFLLGGTSSIRVFETSKNVLQGYINERENWQKPLNGIRDLVNACDKDDPDEVADVEQRFKTYRERVLQASNLARQSA